MPRFSKAKIEEQPEIKRGWSEVLFREEPRVSDAEIQALGYKNRREFNRYAYVTDPSGKHRVRIDHLPGTNRYRTDYNHWLENQRGAIIENYRTNRLPLAASELIPFRKTVDPVAKLQSDESGRRTFHGKTRSARNARLRAYANYMEDLGYFDGDDADDFYQKYKESDE